jgi:hypothetical protein
MVCPMCRAADRELRYRLDAQPKCLRSSERDTRKLRIIPIELRADFQDS